MEQNNLNCRQVLSDRILEKSEPWLEMKQNHVHAGECVEVYLRWGCNMQGGSVPDKDGLTAMVIHPDGKKEELFIQDGNEDYYLLAFEAPEEGCYQVISQKMVCYVEDKEGHGYYCYYGASKECPDDIQTVSYCQTAQIVIPVGHQVREFPLGPNLPVKIQPSPDSLWKVGKPINFTLSVLGKELKNCSFDMAYNGFSGYKSWEEKTDEKGTFIFQPMQTGQYLIVVRTAQLPEDPKVSDTLKLAATYTLLI